MTSISQQDLVEIVIRNFTGDSLATIAEDYNMSQTSLSRYKAEHQSEWGAIEADIRKSEVQRLLSARLQGTDDASPPSEVSSQETELDVKQKQIFGYFFKMYGEYSSRDNLAHDLPIAAPELFENSTAVHAAIEDFEKHFGIIFPV